MASRSKKKLQKERLPLYPILLALTSALIAMILNKGLFFTDIRTFYVQHFSDGMHHWPLSYHTLLGSSNLMHPAEYPALTGLIMWTISFLVSTDANALFHYFWITATLNSFLFAATAYLLLKLRVNKVGVIFFALCPAVLYSLHRNWDIWAVVTMIWAIYLYEKGKTKQSAIVLAVSIATKFFPVVLLLPIAIQYFRNKESKKFFEYFGVTVVSWIIINLPFALINFRGWTYFYEFNYNRGLGAASFFEIVEKLGSTYSFTNVSFYALNLLAFGTVTAYFLYSKSYVPLSEAAFFTMFGFILFNKQYSMQYIIWLTPLAVMALSKLNKRYQGILVLSFISWQIFDAFFQYAYFQNLLTNKYANTATPASPTISGEVYGAIGAMRYVLAVSFCIILGYFLFSEKRVAFKNLKKIL